MSQTSLCPRHRIDLILRMIQDLPQVARARFHIDLLQLFEQEDLPVVTEERPNV